MNVRISDVAVALPKQKYDNNYFASYLETNDEWIKSRTGISTRYMCSEEESSLTLAQSALENLSTDLSTVDGILVASMSSVESCPSVSSQLVQSLKTTNNVYTADINVGCSGFVHTFLMAGALIESGICTKVAIVATEQMSKILDLDDRSTAILFGDAAGVVILEKSQYETVSNIVTKSVSNSDDLYTQDAKLQMNGQNVFKFAVREVSKLIDQINEDEIDYYLLHQANIRIISSISKRTKIEQEKFITNVDEYGNTSATSIVLLINEIYNKLKVNDKLLICGFGAGLTWGGFIYEHKEN